MKILQITMFILGAFIAVNCQKSSDDIKRDEEIEIIFEEKEIIQDNTFEKGFALTPLDHKIVQEGGGFAKTYVDTLDFGRDGSAPVWHLGQWTGHYCLSGAELLTASDGSVYYVNEGGSKKVALYPDNSLLLELNMSKDKRPPDRPYDARPGQFLNIVQTFKNNPNVGKAKQLLFSMELKLEKEEYMDDMDHLLYHGAISSVFFVIVNRNKNSPDFGQWFWIEIGVYYSRHLRTFNREYFYVEAASRQYLYAGPTLPIWGDIDFRDKKWHKGQVDMKRVILRALQLLKGEGVFMRTTPDDLVINNINFGWESRWTDLDLALRVKNISLIKIY